MLENTGWRFFDNANRPTNIQWGPNVKMFGADLKDLSENFDKVKADLSTLYLMVKKFDSLYNSQKILSTK